MQRKITATISAHLCTYTPEFHNLMQNLRKNNFCNKMRLEKCWRQKMANISVYSWVTWAPSFDEIFSIKPEFSQKLSWDSRYWRPFLQYFHIFCNFYLPFDNKYTNYLLVQCFHFHKTKLKWWHIPDERYRKTWQRREMFLTVV